MPGLKQAEKILTIAASAKMPRPELIGWWAGYAGELRAFERGDSGIHPPFEIRNEYDIAPTGS